MRGSKAPIKLFRSIRTVSLFGVKNLNTAKDFVNLSNDVIRRVDTLRLLIRGSLGRNISRNTLLTLDQVSNEICSVIDVAELCRNVHDDELYRESAHEAFTKLSDYIHNLNTDVEMYKALIEVMESKDIISMLTDEDKLFARDLRYEFETGGVHLAGKLLESLTEQKSKLTNLETKFTINVIDNQNPFVVGPFLNSQYNWFRDWLEKFIPQPSTLPHRHILCVSERAVCNTLLKYADVRSVRHQVWTGSISEPARNKDILCALIKSRHRQAELLGYPSHAHYVLSNKILTSPLEVRTFLEVTAASTRTAAEKELELLRQLQRSNSYEDTEVRPWDVARLMEEYRQSNQSASSSLGSISRFLSLPVCVDGLRWLLDSLFGITLVSETVTTEEVWTSSENSQSGVLKFTLQREGDLLGTIYLDLYSRPNKFNGAAHFTIQCGCSNTVEGDRQLPIVALVFSFLPPNKDSDTYLSLHELETFYHEWGHALHSILSRTTYQHLSGTRGGADFVEVPSHLFEHFARCPAIVGQWAKDEFGARLPSGMLEEALMERKLFSATEIQLQLLYSGADQYLFGQELGSRTTLGYEDILVGVANVQRQLTCLPLGLDGQPSVPLLSHTHLVNYGGLYHSYLLARMYASQIWSTQFEADPLSRAKGLCLWHEMLALGSSQSPKGILENMAGGKLQPRHFLRELL